MGTGAVSCLTCRTNESRVVALGYDPSYGASRRLVQYTVNYLYGPHKVFAGCLGGMNTKLPAQCLTRLRIKTYLTLPSKMERKSKFFVLGILECPNSASKHIWSGTFPHLGSLPLLSLLIPQPLYWLISSILSHCDQIHMEN